MDVLPTTMHQERNLEDNYPHHNSQRRESRNMDSPHHSPVSSQRVRRRSESPPNRHKLRRTSSSRDTPTYHDSPRRESSYRDRLLNHKRDHTSYNKEKEADDIQSKKKNIIILGLPETASNRETCWRRHLFLKGAIFCKLLFI